MGYISLAIMLFAPPVLWVVACKKCFGQTTVRAILIAVLAFFIHFMLNDYVIRIAHIHQWTSELAALILYAVYVGIPVVFLLMKRFFRA